MKEPNPLNRYNMKTAIQLLGEYKLVESEICKSILNTDYFDEKSSINIEDTLKQLQKSDLFVI